MASNYSNIMLAFNANVTICIGNEMYEFREPVSKYKQTHIY